MLRSMFLLISSLLLPSIPVARAEEAPAPDLEVRTDRRAPWTAHRIGGDLLGIAWNRYVLDGQIGIGRYHGARVELGWKPGEGRGPLAGLAYELWPQGNGVAGVFLALGGRMGFALDADRHADAFFEAGYRHEWRGATLGVSLGVAHRWSLGANPERAVLPLGRIGLGWAF